MLKWIRRLGLGLLVVLVTGAAGLGYVWRVYLDSGLPKEEVRIPANGETLAGTLWLPEGNGPFPAVVILHGSAPAVRSHPAAQIHANAFAKRGIAALVYDKHGFGESSGTYVHEDYRTFIADAHAALDYLKARPDVIPDALGLVGNSESGWFLPEISLAQDDVRFAYSRVGPAVPYYELADYQNRHRLRRTTELTPDQIDEIVELMNDLYQFYIDADGDAAFYHAATGQEISIHVYPGDDHTLNRMTRILTATYPAGYFDRMVDFALEALAATD